jgi:hypothetical protein
MSQALFTAEQPGLIGEISVKQPLAFHEGKARGLKPMT